MRARKRWVTVFLDCYSRLIMGRAVSLQPSRGTVLAALRQGLVVDPERDPFGGVPAVVPDNGLEFVAAALGGRMELRAASSHNRSYSCRPLGGFHDAGQRTELPTCIGLPAGADG
jgi:transposase InsO family protein